MSVSSASSPSMVALQDQQQQATSPVMSKTAPENAKSCYDAKSIVWNVAKTVALLGLLVLWVKSAQRVQICSAENNHFALGNEQNCTARLSENAPISKLFQGTLFSLDVRCDYNLSDKISNRRLYREGSVAIHKSFRDLLGAFQSWQNLNSSFDPSGSVAIHKSFRDLLEAFQYSQNLNPNVARNILLDPQKHTIAERAVEVYTVGS